MLVQVSQTVYHGGPVKVKASEFKPGLSDRVYFATTRADATDYAKQHSTGVVGEYEVIGNFIDSKSKDFIDFVKELFNNNKPESEDTWEDVASMLLVDSRYFGADLTNEVNEYAIKKGADGFKDAVEISVLPNRINKVLKDR